VGSRTAPIVEIESESYITQHLDIHSPRTTTRYQPICHSEELSKHLQPRVTRVQPASFTLARKHVMETSPFRKHSRHERALFHRPKFHDVQHRAAFSRHLCGTTSPQSVGGPIATEAKSNCAPKQPPGHRVISDQANQVIRVCASTMSMVERDTPHDHQPLSALDPSWFAQY
jgi:hypothetical protein